jgi:hypothetical protein
MQRKRTGTQRDFTEQARQIGFPIGSPGYLVKAISDEAQGGDFDVELEAREFHLSCKGFKPKKQKITFEQASQSWWYRFDGERKEYKPLGDTMWDPRLTSAFATWHLTHSLLRRAPFGVAVRERLSIHTNAVGLFCGRLRAEEIGFSAITHTGRQCVITCEPDAWGSGCDLVARWFVDSNNSCGKWTLGLDDILKQERITKAAIEHEISVACGSPVALIGLIVEYVFCLSDFSLPVRIMYQSKF